jgi:SAM-dependent methyltransferase
VREGYDRASRAYRGDEDDAPRSGHAHWFARLARHVAPGARVLDLGCGNGVPGTRLLAERYDVTGLDLSPVQIERARELVPGARFVCGDMTAAEFAPASFDAVVAYFSIINVPVSRQAALIARVATWLAPGGWLLATVGRVAQTGIERDFRGVKGATMFWSYADVADYRAWFAAAGFAIEEEGVQPRDGDPGFAMMLARRAGGAVAGAEG